MLTKADILSFLHEQKDEFFTQYQLVRLGLFGSFARDEAGADSDIDLLVEFQPNTTDLSGKKQDLKDRVRQQFDRPVDVCREKYIKPYYRAQILQSVVYV